MMKNRQRSVIRLGGISITLLLVFKALFIKHLAKVKAQYSYTFNGVSYYLTDQFFTIVYSVFPHA